MPQKKSQKKVASKAKVAGKAAAVKAGRVLKKNAKVIAGAAAGLAAAGTAAYLLTGKRGAKTRKQIGKIAKKIRTEAGKQARQVKKTAKKAYSKAVDAVASQTDKLSQVDAKDVMEFTDDLKKRWQVIAREVRQAAAQAKKIAPAKALAASNGGRAKSKRNKA